MAGETEREHGGNHIWSSKGFFFLLSMYKYKDKDI